MDEMPAELLAGIGEIIARWGYLQFQLGAVIREVAGIRDYATGRVLTVGPELGVLCNQLRVLTASDHWIGDRHKALRDELRAFAKDVQDQSHHRNDYAHGVFGYGEQPGTFARLLVKTTHHRVSPGEEILTVALLKTRAQEAADLWVRAQRLTTTLKSLRGKLK